MAEVAKALASSGGEGGSGDVLDLTHRGTVLPTDASLASVGDREKFRQRVAWNTEKVRTILAFIAFCALVALLTALLISIFKEITADNIEKVSTVVVAPLTGIVGTIVGFYFATRTGD